MITWTNVERTCPMHRAIVIALGITISAAIMIGWLVRATLTYYLYL